ncbi:hypothetical protein ACWGI9_43745 [Streptomyces sp. NPDC054833]
MHSNDDTGRTSGGLTTEDLAQPSGATTATPGQTEGTSSRAPIYPGEGTATTEAPSPADEAGGGRSAADGSGTEAATTGVAGTPDTSGTSGTSDDEAPQLLMEDEDRDFRDRWQKIQTRFVDDPREAVHDADALVADVMQTLATTFAQHKKDLEEQWGEGEQVDTEELRRALRRYRSFFNRLLST